MKIMAKLSVVFSEKKVIIDLYNLILNETVEVTI